MPTTQSAKALRLPTATLKRDHLNPEVFLKKGKERELLFPAPPNFNLWLKHR